MVSVIIVVENCEENIVTLSLVSHRNCFLCAVTVFTKFSSSLFEHLKSSKGGQLNVVFSQILICFSFSHYKSVYNVAFKKHVNKPYFKYALNI